jgi:hypothetical protein
MDKNHTDDDVTASETQHEESQSTCSEEEESQNDSQESTDTESDEDEVRRANYILRYAINAGKQGVLSSSTYNTMIKALGILAFPETRTEKEIEQMGYDIQAAAKEASEYETATGIEINMDL